MQSLLQIIESDSVSIHDKELIETQIEAAISRHRNNHHEISKLVFDSISILSKCESRAEELASQGLLKKLFKNFTGENQKLRDDINSSLAHSQYASQQTIQKLAEQNLLSFELITSINNKLNASLNDIDNEINNIYSTLIVFFKELKGELVRVTNRIDKLEKNMNLHNWICTLEYNTFNKVEYKELSDCEKLVCLARDFYEIMHCEWDDKDILLLKSAFREIGLASNNFITYGEFFYQIICNDRLFDNFFFMDVADYTIIDENIPLLLAACKYKMLKTDEKYIVNTLLDICNNADKKLDSIDLEHMLVRNYVNQKSGFNFEYSMSYFDLVLELLFSYKYHNNAECIRYDNENVLETSGEVATFSENNLNEIWDMININIIVKETDDYIYYFCDEIYGRRDKYNKLFRINKDSLFEEQLLDTNDDFFKDMERLFEVNGNVFDFEVINDKEIVYIRKNYRNNSFINCSINIYNFDDESDRQLYVTQNSDIRFYGFKFMKENRVNFIIYELSKDYKFSRIKLFDLDLTSGCVKCLFNVHLNEFIGFVSEDTKSIRSFRIEYFKDGIVLLPVNTDTDSILYCIDGEMHVISMEFPYDSVITSFKNGVFSYNTMEPIRRIQHNNPETAIYKINFDSKEASCVKYLVEERAKGMQFSYHKHLLYNDYIISNNADGLFSYYIKNFENIKSSDYEFTPMEYINFAEEDKKLIVPGSYDKMVCRGDFIYCINRDDSDNVYRISFDGREILKLS